MPEADNEIITRIVLMADEAIEKARAYRDEVDGVKATVSLSSSEQKVALKDLEVAWVSLAESQKKAALEMAKTSVVGDESQRKTQIDAIAKQWDEAITRLKAAFKEAGEEEKKYFAEQAAIGEQAQQGKLQALKESQDAEAEYIRITRQGYGVMSEAAKQYEAQIQAIKQQIIDQAKTSGQSYQQVAEGLAKAGIPINQINQALRELDAQIKKTSGGFRLFGMEIRSIGDIAKAVFTGIFGITVIGILRNIVRWFGEVTKSGTEFIRSMFQMEMGVRALQRSGVEITIQDVYENIDKLGKRFGIFSKKELVEGSAALINLVRDFGFTKDQVFELQEAIATLAVVNGRAMDDVQRTVALAISSGYTEGLQRLGVSINRVVIAQKAAALGYAENYMALTELQRAEATRLLVLEKTAKYDEDALKRQDRAAGAADKLNAAWSNFTLNIGKQIASLLAGINYFIASLLGAAEAGYEAGYSLSLFGIELEDIGTLIATTAKAASEFARVLSREITFDEAINNIRKFRDEWQQALDDLEPTELDRIQEAVSKALDDLLDYQKDFAQKSKDIELDYQRDLEKIDRDGISKRTDLLIDYLRKRIDIKRDAARDEAEENQKYALDVAQTERQFAIRRAEMQANYRENEKKAEIKFQEDLRRLREGFLFDLEDALHERDARQVLRLIRQYNLQKNQATRQYEIEKDERARAHKLELKELEQQRQERLRILAEEHAARLAAIQSQANYELEMARLNWERDKKDLERRLEEQKAERDIRLKEQMDDLAAAKEDILKQIGEDLWTQLHDDTEWGLNELYKALLDTLGPGGEADRVLDYYKDAMSVASQNAIVHIGTIAAAFKTMFAAANIRMPGLSTPVPPSGGGGGGGSFPYTPVTSGGGRQTGGPVEAGKSYSVAEKGIEVFTRPGTFIPDVGGQVYNQDQFLDLMNKQASRGGEGKVRIGVSLSPDLVGSIIENTLGQVSDVVFELERKRR